MLAGILSLTPVFITFACSDVMNEIYPGYQYSFYCVMPQYVSIPFVLLLVKLLDKLNLSMTIKVFIAYSGTLVGMLSIPFYTFETETSKFNFWMIMLILLITFIFANLLQTLTVSIASIYDQKWIGVYFQFQPVSNIIINVLKNLIDLFKLNNRVDFFIIFGYGALVAVLTGYFFTKLIRCNRYYKSFLHIETKSNALNYSSGWKASKFEALGLFFTMFLCFLPWPGIFFTAVPVTIFDPSRYIVILNSIAALFDWFGRYFAAKPYSKAWVTFSFGIMLVLNFFMMLFYFNDWNLSHEGICYLMIPILAFFLFRTAFSITYFMIQTNIKADENNRDAVGAIMSNILVFGICCGNLSSLFVTFLKGKLIQ